MHGINNVKAGEVLEIRHNRFLPDPCQFIIHCYWTLRRALSLCQVSFVTCFRADYRFELGCLSEPPS
jgi:hypothetical protein